jgi:hypothetical protein
MHTISTGNFQVCSSVLKQNSIVQTNRSANKYLKNLRKRSHVLFVDVQVPSPTLITTSIRDVEQARDHKTEY